MAPHQSSLNNWNIRRATSDDLDELVRLRMAFLNELGATNTRLKSAIRTYLSEHLETKEFIAWLAVAGKTIIATSGLVFVRKPPNASNLTGLEAYVMNMYTVPTWRRQGIGTELLKFAINYARQSRAECIRLHEVPGVGIYRAIGFQEVKTELVLRLEKL